MQVVILNLQSLLEIAQCTSKFLGSSKHTCEVVIGHCSESVTFFGQRFSLSEQLQRHVKVF